MSDAVHILAVVTIAPEKAKGAEEAISRCAAHSQKEEACQRYEIARDLEKPGRFAVGEIWASQAGFEKHLASAHFGALAEFVKEQGAELDVLKLQPLEPAA